MREALLLAGVLVSACTSPEPSSPSGPVTPPTAGWPAPSPAPGPAPAPLPTPLPRPTTVGADGCTGRTPHDCAQTPGCLLDQPTYRGLHCRPAVNACERAVRHADLIGPDADPRVAFTAMTAAQAACTATPGCAVTSGNCSCPCALLANCNCACGGSYLRRCTTLRERDLYDGRPAAEGVTGPLGPLGDALVRVRRAPRDQGFAVDPMPPIDALVGRRRHEIEGTLGTAHACLDTSAAPCTSTDQVFYSFYVLPPGARGGGPELVLVYDESQVCREARVVLTR